MRGNNDFYYGMYMAAAIEAVGTIAADLSGFIRPSTPIYIASSLMFVAAGKIISKRGKPKKLPHYTPKAFFEPH